MNLHSPTEQALLAENAELRGRLEDREETLRAIRAGEVDALVVDSVAGPQIFVLESSEIESNRFRSDILGKVRDAVVAVDDEDHVIYLNEAARLQYGVTFSEALGHALSELYEARWLHPGDEEAARNNLEKHGHWRGRNLHVKRNGEIIQVESTLNRFLSKEGSPSGMLSVMRDVTAQSEAEEALRKSEELYRTLFDSIDEGFCIIEVLFDENMAASDYRFIQVSPSFEKHTGLKNVEGVTMKQIAPHHEAYWFEIYGKVALTGESVRFQNHAKEVGRWFDVHASRFGDPSNHLVAVLFNDVTTKVFAEDALRASEQRANNIVQSITDGFITMDCDWRITYLSSRGAEILKPLQKTTSNVLGKIFWNEFPNTLGTVIEKNYRQAMRLQIPVQFEAFYSPLDRWFDLRVYPSASGISLFFLDITERKKVEHALRESQRVLAAQAEELRTADRSKDEFLAMLAHELRNPLSPLRNASEILRSADGSAEEREQAQSIIGRQIENMSRMIDDLLDVSRITEGKIELRKKPVDLNAILTEAANSARAGCLAQKQTLTVELVQSPTYVDADSTRLEQVFGNLLGNATKYGGEGCEILLKAEMDLSTAFPQAIITVKDNGAGIDPALLPRIFDLFVQASRTLDRAHGGLGIGLTLVQRLIRLHGGHVEARSDGLGHGSEFKIYLPILSHHSPAVSTLPKNNNKERPRRMLIVDDNADSARSLATLQQRRGHTTRVAFTGPDAVVAALEFSPEVVLLDIGLPGMDGFEVARQIRNMDGVSNAFIVAMSGYGREEDFAEARLAGFDEYLVKPLDLASLRSWLQERD